jgi:hypothetical protein
MATNWNQYFLKIHSHHFLKIKSNKEVKNSRNQGFSYYFFLIEGSGSGSVPLINGCGSRRLKNIQIRIRIHNTAWNPFLLLNSDIVWADYLQTETVVETNKFTNKVRILVLLKVNTVSNSCTSVDGEDVSGEL